jgi:hypothetical protein
MFPFQVMKIRITFLESLTIGTGWNITSKRIGTRFHALQLNTTLRRLLTSISFLEKYFLPMMK